MSGIGIARTVHLVGVIFWVGGMGARLILLGSRTSGTDESARSQLYEAQRRIHLRLELPAFLLALLAGLFLVHASGVTFHQAWFSVKMLLLLGVILLDPLASRQFKALRSSGKGGRAAGLIAVLVVLALLMVLATLTKF
ncbi:MAG: CopD family protein [candidate division NC10 bacterium]|nr:CopD family protein [candidate division NC10 bacterium]